SGILSVCLYVDNHGVLPYGGLGVLEGLVRHHMAPGVGVVADGYQHGHVAAACLGQSLLAPRPPLHRVVGVLQQVPASRLAQSVGHTHNCAGRPDLAPRNGLRTGRSHASAGRTPGTLLGCGVGRGDVLAGPLRSIVGVGVLVRDVLARGVLLLGGLLLAAFSAFLFSAKGVSLLVMLRMRKYRTRAIPKITRKPSTPGVTRSVFNSVRSANTIAETGSVFMTFILPLLLAHPRRGPSRESRCPRSIVRDGSPRSARPRPRSRWAERTRNRSDPPGWRVP